MQLGGHGIHLELARYTVQDASHSAAGEVDFTHYEQFTGLALQAPEAPPATAQAVQVRLLADACGLDAASRSRLIDVILDRQVRNAQWWRSHLTHPRIRPDKATDRGRAAACVHAPLAQYRWPNFGATYS